MLQRDCSLSKLRFTVYQSKMPTSEAKIFAPLQDAHKFVNMVSNTVCRTRKASARLPVISISRIHIWTSVNQGPGCGISVPWLLIDILLIDISLQEPKASNVRLWYCRTICLHYQNTVIKYHISESVILCSLVTMFFITATF